MPYNDAQEFAILGGSPGFDVLGSTPGFAGPLRDGSPLDFGRAAMADAQEQFVLYKGLFDKKGRAVSAEELAAARARNPLGVAVGEGLGLIRNENDARQDGPLEKWVSRGVYLVGGFILLIIGLVMLSRPVREGAVEGFIEGAREALNE